jgi:hypothetical protein
LLLWNWLRLDARSNLARNKLLDEGPDLLFREVTALERVFLVLDRLLDRERGEFIGWKIQVSSVCTKCLGVDRREVDLALVFLCDGLEGFSKRGALFGCLSENVSERDAGLEAISTRA